MLGNVSLIDDKGNVVFVNSLVLVDRMRNGVLSGFGVLIGNNGWLVVVSVQCINGMVVIVNRVVYSFCAICN